jgi:hypothetical protein
MPPMSFSCRAIALWFGLTLGLLLGMPGCAVTSADGDRMPAKSEAFSTYVADVFQRQNEISTELSLALDGEEPGSARYLVLENAELDLFTTCRGLNQIARSRRDGEQIRGLGALKRARQAPACERATAAAAELLP